MTPPVHASPSGPTERFVAALAITLALVGCGGGGGSAEVQPAAIPCANADHLTRVSGAGECLVIDTTLGTGPTNVLLVVVHGDVSAGGNAEYLYAFARQHAGPGVTAVALLRPGYYDARGNQSTGTNYERVDSYTAENIAAVADAIERLERFHGARKVVYFGHSGGAAYGGVLAGKHPGVIDAALLVSCPCDITRWRAERNATAWTRSLSPGDFVATVPLQTRIVAITGSADPNTFPALGRDYVAMLRQRGVDATYFDVPGAVHEFATLREDAALLAALQSLLVSP